MDFGPQNPKGSFPCGPEMSVGTGSRRREGRNWSTGDGDGMVILHGKHLPSPWDGHQPHIKRLPKWWEIEFNWKVGLKSTLRQPLTLKVSTQTNKSKQVPPLRITQKPKMSLRGIKHYFLWRRLLQTSIQSSFSYLQPWIIKRFLICEWKQNFVDCVHMQYSNTFAMVLKEK